LNILFDIGHPGHVHLLKDVYHQLKNNGHNIWVTVKNIQAAKILLEKYHINFIDIGTKNDSLIAKAISQLDYNLKVLQLVNRNKIEMGIGSSLTIAHVSKLSKMKSIILDDDDDDAQPLFVKFAHPFADILLSPDSLKSKRKRKDTIFYSGYHELAYLHPNRFKADKNILREIGVNRNEQYFILRFNAFKAHHDVGIFGMTLDKKLILIEKLEHYGQVFISNERKIEPELEKYQFHVSPEKMHSLMFYATMFLSDSQTMTSEAAILGVPALKCNSFAGMLSVPNELEKKYDLCYSYQPSDFDKFLSKTSELLGMSNAKSVWQEKRQKVLDDKIDVSAFLVWFIENYPKSAIIMKERPEFQNRFRYSITL
jgi:uncharacterized protein